MIDLERELVDAFIAADPASIDAIRTHCRRQLSELPDSFRPLDSQAVYPLSYSDVLENEAERLGVK